MTTTRYDPFVMDGVQTVILGAPSHSDTTITGSRASRLRDEVRAVGEAWACVENKIEAAYYGFDPYIRDEHGEIVGTDSYPDAIGRWDFDLEEFLWERT